jgi:hypothetical protein
VPTKSRRETELIRLFYSAYQNGVWAADRLETPDEKIDGAIDGFVKRGSDGRRLAIEHTLIQPYPDDRKDFALFEQYLLPIERDDSLKIQGQIIWVYVKFGTLKPGSNFSLVSEALHEWLRKSVETFPIGNSWRECPMNGAQEPILLSVRVFRDPTYAGAFLLRRYYEGNNLRAVVEQALRDKLPKLVNTPSDQRVLLLEREHMALDERTILQEIEARRSEFPGLNGIDMWFAETIFYDRDKAVLFNQYENNRLSKSLTFLRGRLKTKVENGVGTVVERI